MYRDHFPTYVALVFLLRYPPFFFSSQQWRNFPSQVRKKCNTRVASGCVCLSRHELCAGGREAAGNVSVACTKLARCVFAVSCRSRDRALLSVPKRQCGFGQACVGQPRVSVCPWARDDRCSRSRRVKHMVTISKKWEHITEAKKRQDAQVRSDKLKKTL